MGRTQIVNLYFLSTLVTLLSKVKFPGQILLVLNYLHLRTVNFPCKAPVGLSVKPGNALSNV